MWRWWGSNPQPFSLESSTESLCSRVKHWVTVLPVCRCNIILCIRETPKRVLLRTAKTQMKCSIMLHGLHCLLIQKQSSGNEVQILLEISSTFDPLKYIMENPILTAFICKGKCTRIQRDKVPKSYLLAHIPFLPNDLKATRLQYHWKHG